MRLRIRVLALLCAFLLSSCTLPGSDVVSMPLEDTPEAQASVPDICRGDGAVQTWQLLPVQPAGSDLMTAYANREVVEFSGAVFGSDDDPSRLPHRRFVIREAAEGITVTLDYQGDPPPLAFGPRYRFVAWADFLSEPAAGPAGSATATPAQQIPDALSYELQIHDQRGLLFLGLTDTDLADDPLDIRIEDAESECPVVAITNNLCVQSRQSKPLRITWGDEEITLYPGDDGELQHDGAVYEVSVFRNRQVSYADPPCPGYYEHQRSLRIERIDPPPVAPSPAPPPTSTLPLSATLPITPDTLLSPQ